MRSTARERTNSVLVAEALYRSHRRPGVFYRAQGALRIKQGLAALAGALQGSNGPFVGHGLHTPQACLGVVAVEASATFVP